MTISHYYLTTGQQNWLRKLKNQNISQTITCEITGYFHMVYFGRISNTNHHKQRLFILLLNISMDMMFYSNHDMNPYSPLTTTPSTTNPKHIAIYHTRGEPPPYRGFCTRGICGTLLLLCGC